MAGGRPRKLTCISSGKVGKEVRAERQKQESKLKLQRDDLEPPAFLEDAGKQSLNVSFMNVKKSIFWTIWI